MADTYLSELTKKDNPSDSDIMLLEDSEDTKRIDYNKLADAILNKLTSKTYSTLNTSNKTLPGAINGLNADLMNKMFCYRGEFSGNIDDYYVSNGYLQGAYEINGVQIFDHEVYGSLILLPNFEINVQIIISSRDFMLRTRTGSPQKWGAWKRATLNTV